MNRLFLVVPVVVAVSLAGCGAISAATSTDNPTADADRVTDGNGSGNVDRGTVATRTGTGTDDPGTPTAELPDVPLVDSGLVLHLEADAGVSTADGAVTRWADQSGYGNHLTAEGGPILRESALNGRDVISFDGRDDLLNRTGGLDGLPEDDENRTMFVVVNHEGPGSGGVGYGRERAGGNLAFQLVVDEDGLLELNAFGKPNDFLVPVNATRRGWMTRSVVVRNDTFAHFMNGTRYDAGAHEFDTRLEKIVVGAEVDYDPKVEMQVAAVLVYDRALTAGERRQVRTYLYRKYLPGVARDSNVPPRANDDVVTVTNGSAATVDVLANDWDPDGTIDAGTVVALNRSRGRRGPMYGHVSVNPTTGTVTYDHAGSCLVTFYPCRSNATDSFTYTVLDADGEPSNVATVSVNVTGRE